MIFNNALLFEMAITWVVVRIAGTAVYKRFADSLALVGGERVLDFGCGFGTVARYVAPLLSNGALTCADISTFRLKHCKKNIRNHENTTFENLLKNPDPFSDESFDLIYCHFVLHEIQDDELDATIIRLCRWLKQQGKLVFREPSKDNVKLRQIDHMLLKLGLVRDATRITEIPLIGSAIEGRYTKWKG